MNISYKKTKFACFMTILVQGVINNLSPLLFIIFSSELGLSFVQLSLLITLNFTLQIAVDFLSSFISGRLGYRTCIVMANILAATGIISTSKGMEINPVAARMFAITIQVR